MSQVLRASLGAVARKMSSSASGGALKQLGPEGRVVQSMAEVETKGKLVLFNNRVCPFGHRAWWAMMEKGLEGQFDYVHIELGETKPAWYARDVNPAGTVPCLIDNGESVFESLICAEYLDDKYPEKGTKLMPKAPLDRANVRFVVDAFGNKCIPAMYRLLMNQDASKDGELVNAVQSGLKAVNDIFAAQSEGPYFLGERFSFADLAIVTFLDRFSATLPYWRGFDPLPEGGKDTDRLLAVYEACKSRPAFKATSQSPEFYEKFYTSYAKERRDVTSNL